MTNSTSQSVSHVLPDVPYEWPVPDSDVTLVIIYYYRRMAPDNVFSCIIEALGELHGTAIFDHGDSPVRGDSYQQQKYDVSIDVTRRTESDTPILHYSTVAKALLGIEQIYHMYHATYGLSAIVYDRGHRVARAALKPAAKGPVQ